MNIVRVGAIAALLLLAVGSEFVFADGLTEKGLDDPEVTKPAQTWTGPYAGLSYGRSSKSSTSESCRKVFEGVDYGAYPCDDPIFTYYPETKVIDSVTETSREGQAGAFVGYRKDFGWRMVGGVELGVLGEFRSLEAQAGLDLGRVLAYGLVGAGQMDGESGMIYGAGADVKLGNRLFVGAKYVTGDFDDDVTTVRLGIQF